MRYMGSKRRIADEILPIILKGRRPSQYYVEPFCGGCNTLERVDGKRIAGDIHPELIAMYKALQNGWLPPKVINEDEYKRIMKLGSPELKGYAGFTHSFGAKFGSTYRRQTDDRISKEFNFKPAKGAFLKGHYMNQSYNGQQSFDMVIKHNAKLEGVYFYCCSYFDLPIPKNSLIYCDPPYAGTSEYVTAKFPTDNFWLWAEQMVDDGHKVFVSEYNAPKHFKCVWEKKIKTHLNSHRGKAFEVTEKLFTL